MVQYFPKQYESENAYFCLSPSALLRSNVADDSDLPLKSVLEESFFSEVSSKHLIENRSTVTDIRFFTWDIVMFAVNKFKFVLPVVRLHIGFFV
jgi:hypothetical protein